MDNGTGTIQIDGFDPVTYEFSNYSTFGTVSPTQLTYFLLSASKAAVDVKISDLKVGKNSRYERYGDFDCDCK